MNMWITHGDMNKIPTDQARVSLLLTLRNEDREWGCNRLEYIYDTLLNN